MPIKKNLIVEKPLDVRLMAGLILTIFEKNKYCANQITAVLEIIGMRVEKYKNLEPISFDDFEGKASEIRDLHTALEKNLIRSFFE